MESSDPAALDPRLKQLGFSDRDLMRVYRTFNAGAAPFREASEAHEAHDQG
jgi:hypothetical protein